MKKIYAHFKFITGLTATLLLFLMSQNLNAQNIIGHPKDVSVFGGYTGSVYFAIDVIPDAIVTYQWFFKEPDASTGKEMTGETAPVLEVSFPLPIDPAKWNGVGYYCVVTGDVEEVSLHAYLWVQQEPKVEVITGHPADVTEEAGFSGEINYNVEVTAGLKADIFWFKRAPDDVAVWKEVGAGPQLTEKVIDLDPRQNGTAYRCLVRHEDGEEYSQVAYLWVKEPKKLILTEPVDVYKPEGFVGAITFDITPGAIGILFQWQIRLPGKTWVDYSGAEKPVFEFPVKEPLGPELDGMAVRCIARFKDITEVSEPAYLHMEEVNKFILVDPEDVMKKQGFTGDLYFAIKYDDSYVLAFQWQERKPGGSWVDITDFPAYKPELVYSIKEPLTTDWNGWGFRCVATDKATGDVENSGEANLYVSLYETYFLGHPRNATICEGAEGAVKFAVKVIEKVELRLQWQMSPAGDKNWYDITGADSTLYVKEFSEVPLSYNGYAYRCKAVDEYGGTEFSDIAFLYVRGLPRITIHPESQEKMVGEAVTFNVTATGYKPFSYQWLKDDNPLSGATAASLSLFPLALSDAGDYNVIVSNACANPGDTSNAATLSVVAPLFEDGWFAQSAIGNNFTDIKFAGASTGWITQLGSKFVYKTVDGGENWNTVDVTDSRQWQAVFTTDADKVWIAGQAMIKYTTNGSNATPTWTDGVINAVPLAAAPSLYDLFFINSTTGWSVGMNGLVLNTTNSGVNWSPQHSGDIDGFVTTQDLNAVHFVDADTGFAVGNSGVILVTRDGGGSWATPTPVTSSVLRDVYFINDQVGWISGTSGVLLNTLDGGRNWSTVSVPGSVSAQDLNGVHFYDFDHGWIITGNGKILRTNDGGDTWYFQESGTSQALNAIDFADYDNGWIVGNTQTILRTAYSGCLLPRISLFEDKEFCASVNYELVADSFASNVNCDYLWSHGGGTTGKYTVTESGKYWVRVTSVCGVEVSDTVNVLLYPLPEPYAGSDQEICDGDSVQLLATGGVGYNWDNAGLLDDANIQNPKAGPPIGNTDFIVTVTDENLCQNTDTVRVTVYPIPTSTFTAPSAICDGDSAAITYTGSASAYANFYWNFDERSTVLSGDSIGPYGVSWDTSGVFSIELVVEENGCSSDTSKADLTIHPIPVSDFDLESAICGSDQVEVEYTGTVSLDADFTWDFDGATVTSGDVAGPGPIQLSWATAGTKQVTLDVSDNGCESEQTSNEIVVAYPYDEQTICLVTVDIETGKIAIIWEKGDHPGVEFYRIYRESVTGGVYDPIATLPADTLSYYIDETSQPESKSHKYRISAIDTCGNESDVSLYHKSMLLTTSTGADRINVSWTEYEVEQTGFGFVTYIIYRGPAPNELDSLTSIPADNTLYPDINPPEGDNYYQVAGVVEDACSPSGNFKAGTGPYSHSLSNLDDNKLQGTGIRDANTAGINLNIYPNPFQEKVRVEYSLQDNASVNIEVFNLLGVRILELMNGNQVPGVYNYDIMASDLDQSSIYYLRFTVDGMTTVTKLIPAR